MFAQAVLDYLQGGNIIINANNFYDWAHAYCLCFDNSGHEHTS